MTTYDDLLVAAGRSGRGGVSGWETRDIKKSTARPGSGCPLGASAKGQRWHDWAWITIPGTGPACRYLLIRRSRRTRELASYRCYCPHRVPLATLAMLALAFLSVTAAAEHAQPRRPS